MNPLYSLTWKWGHQNETYVKLPKRVGMHINSYIPKSDRCYLFQAMQTIQRLVFFFTNYISKLLDKLRGHFWLTQNVVQYMFVNMRINRCRHEDQQKTWCRDSLWDGAETAGTHNRLLWPLLSEGCLQQAIMSEKNIWLKFQVNNVFAF